VCVQDFPVSLSHSLCVRLCVSLYVRTCVCFRACVCAVVCASPPPPPPPPPPVCVLCQAPASLPQPWTFPKGMGLEGALARVEAANALEPYAAKLRLHFADGSRSGPPVRSSSSPIGGTDELSFGPWIRVCVCLTESCSITGSIGIGWLWRQVDFETSFHSQPMVCGGGPARRETTRQRFPCHRFRPSPPPQ